MLLSAYGVSEKFVKENPQSVESLSKMCADDIRNWIFSNWKI